MRNRTARFVRPHRLAAVLVLGALTLALLAASVAAASSGSMADSGAAAASPAAPSAPALEPSSSPSPTDSPQPTAITCALSSAAIVFGETVTVSGAVTPVAAGQQVVIALDGVDVGAVTTDAGGAYSLAIKPRRSGTVVARVVADGTLGEPQAIAVKPRVAIAHGALVPFLRARVVVKVQPSAYAGVVRLRVSHRGTSVAVLKARVKQGRAVFQVPLNGISRFTLACSLPAGEGLAARSTQTALNVKWRRLAAGSTGPHVKGMLTALSRLKIRVPNTGTRLTTQVKDSVMAFQKAYRLPRTYVFDGDDWRKLDGAKTVKPRYSGPSTHLEVDKGRQILMVVKNGKVYGLICVSTGATGNTPEGRFSIQQKHPFTTSGYGGILVRTMGFIGDFAIHGYSPVPPYPASHGCIREPIWACYWVYDQSFVGERLYVYH